MEVHHVGLPPSGAKVPRCDRLRPNHHGGGKPLNRDAVSSRESLLLGSGTLPTRPSCANDTHIVTRLGGAVG